MTSPALGFGAAFAAGDVLGPALAELAASLRRSTVEMRTGGGSGVGSGIIWHTDGLIVTNAHVARDDDATVVLWNGHPLDGRVVARDSRRDLAAIVTPPDARLREIGLPAAIGQPATLRPGDLVVALGNPLGIVGALALGVVHAVESGRRGMARWIRADIRLAPGNSGGPLADARGRVVGINTMIAGGLGIAVSVSTVERFLEEAGLRARPAESRAA